MWTRSLTHREIIRLSIIVAISFSLAAGFWIVPRSGRVIYGACVIGLWFVVRFALTIMGAKAAKRRADA